MSRPILREDPYMPRRVPTLAASPKEKGLHDMPNEAAVAVTARPSAAVPDSHKTTEARRQYLRAYYRRNLERSRQYQREYNLRHKKKQPTSNPEAAVPRSVRKISVHASDIMHAAPEKAARIIDQVVRGDRQLVAVARQKIT